MSLTIDHFDESLIVKERLEDVCPKMKLEDMDVLEVQKSCKVGFEIIGYKPQNFDEAFTKTWESSDAVMLWEFIYDMWRIIS